jgi:glycosyltransferase involved in cell wall biosynthesis
VDCTVQCPTLSELPAPPSGRTGWPWTEESNRLPRRGPEGGSWPRLSVITPSFNQGQFIEETIRSILLQGYPNLEYFIMDGGSTDGSVEIIEKYSPWLSHWVSQTDRGQSDAINRGLTLASGDFATWINSDDLLSKNALVEHASRIGVAPDTVYVGNCIIIDETGKVLSSHRGTVQSLEDLVRVKTVWYAGGHIVQPEVMFPRELYLTVGGLDCNNQFTMDFDLWGKFFLAGARFQYTDIDFAMFRLQPNQKIQDGLTVARSLVESAKKLVYQAKAFSENVKQTILAELDAFEAAYPDEHWKATGRLARIGLPRRIVTPLRNLRATLHKKAQILLRTKREQI